MAETAPDCVLDFLYQLVRQFMRLMHDHEEEYSLIVISRSTTAYTERCRDDLVEGLGLDDGVDIRRPEADTVGVQNAVTAHVRLFYRVGI